MNYIQGKRKHLAVCITEMTGEKEESTIDRGKDKLG
jgi:hypothetical protein